MSSFHPETRSRLLAHMVVDLDPAGSTVEVKVGDTWHTATWLGDPVEERPGRWTQTARTVDYFAGPEVANPAGAVVIPAGVVDTATAVTFSTGDRVVQAASQLGVA